MFEAPKDTQPTTAPSTPKRAIGSKGLGSVVAQTTATYIQHTSSSPAGSGKKSGAMSKIRIEHTRFVEEQRGDTEGMRLNTSEQRTDSTFEESSIAADTQPDIAHQEPPKNPRAAYEALIRERNQRSPAYDKNQLSPMYGKRLVTFSSKQSPTASEQRQEEPQAVMSSSSPKFQGSWIKRQSVSSPSRPATTQWQSPRKESPGGVVSSSVAEEKRDEAPATMPSKVQIPWKKEQGTTRSPSYQLRSRDPGKVDNPTGTPSNPDVEKKREEEHSSITATTAAGVKTPPVFQKSSWTKKEVETSSETQYVGTSPLRAQSPIEMMRKRAGVPMAPAGRIDSHSPGSTNISSATQLLRPEPKTGSTATTPQRNGVVAKVQAFSSSPRKPSPSSEQGARTDEKTKQHREEESTSKAQPHPNGKITSQPFRSGFSKLNAESHKQRGSSSPVGMFPLFPSAKTVHPRGTPRKSPRFNESVETWSVSPSRVSPQHENAASRNDVDQKNKQDHIKQTQQSETTASSKRTGTGKSEVEATTNIKSQLSTDASIASKKSRSRLMDVRSRSPALFKQFTLDLKRNGELVPAATLEVKPAGSGCSVISSKSSMSNEELGNIAQQAAEMSLSESTTQEYEKASPLSQMKAFKRSRYKNSKPREAEKDMNPSLNPSPFKPLALPNNMSEKNQDAPKSNDGFKKAIVPMIKTTSNMAGPPIENQNYVNSTKKTSKPTTLTQADLLNSASAFKPAGRAVVQSQKRPEMAATTVRTLGLNVSAHHDSKKKVDVNHPRQDEIQTTLSGRVSRADRYAALLMQKGRSMGTRGKAALLKTHKPTDTSTTSFEKDSSGKLGKHISNMAFSSSTSSDHDAKKDEPGKGSLATDFSRRFASESSKSDVAGSQVSTAFSTDFSRALNFPVSKLSSNQVRSVSESTTTEETKKKFQKNFGYVSRFAEQFSVRSQGPSTTLDSELESSSRAFLPFPRSQILSWEESSQMMKEGFGSVNKETSNKASSNSETKIPNKDTSRNSKLSQVSTTKTLDNNPLKPYPTPVVPSSPIKGISKNTTSTNKIGLFKQRSRIRQHIGKRDTSPKLTAPQKEEMTPNKLSLSQRGVFARNRKNDHKKLQSPDKDEANSGFRRGRPSDHSTQSELTNGSKDKGMIYQALESPLSSRATPEQIRDSGSSANSKVGDSEPLHLVPVPNPENNKKKMEYEVSQNFKNWAVNGFPTEWKFPERDVAVMLTDTQEKSSKEDGEKFVKYVPRITVGQTGDFSETVDPLAPNLIELDGHNSMDTLTQDEDDAAHLPSLRKCSPGTSIDAGEIKPQSPRSPSKFQNVRSMFENGLKKSPVKPQFDNGSKQLVSPRRLPSENFVSPAKLAVSPVLDIKQRSPLFENQSKKSPSPDYDHNSSKQPVSENASKKTFIFDNQNPFDRKPCPFDEEGQKETSSPVFESPSRQELILLLEKPSVSESVSKKSQIQESSHPKRISRVEAETKKVDTSKEPWVDQPWTELSVEEKLMTTMERLYNTNIDESRMNAQQDAMNPFSLSAEYASGSFPSTFDETAMDTVDDELTNDVLSDVAANDPSIHSSLLGKGTTQSTIDQSGTSDVENSLLHGELYMEDGSNLQYSSASKSLKMSSNEESARLSSGTTNNLLSSSSSQMSKSTISREELLRARTKSTISSGDTERMVSIPDVIREEEPGTVSEDASEQKDEKQTTKGGARSGESGFGQARSDGTSEPSMDPSKADALRWWQKKYAQKVGERTDTVVKKAFSRKQPVIEKDDEDVFSGLEEDPKASFERNMNETLSSPTYPEEPPITSNIDSQHDSSNPGSDGRSALSAISLEGFDSIQSVPPPPPPLPLNNAHPHKDEDVSSNVKKGSITPEERRSRRSSFRKKVGTIVEVSESEMSDDIKPTEAVKRKDPNRHSGKLIDSYEMNKVTSDITLSVIEGRDWKRSTTKSGACSKIEELSEHTNEDSGLHHQQKNSQHRVDSESRHGRNTTPGSGVEAHSHLNADVLDSYSRMDSHFGFDPLDSNSHHDSHDGSRDDKIGESESDSIDKRREPTMSEESDEIEVEEEDVDVEADEDPERDADSIDVSYADSREKSHQSTMEATAAAVMTFGYALVDSLAQACKITGT